MTQYLDVDGAAILAQKIKDAIKIVPETEFDSATMSKTVYCVTSPNPLKEYLYIKALSDGAIEFTTAVDSTLATSISWSKDKETWNTTTITSGTQTVNIPVSKGECVYNCKKLNSITMLATDISALYCLTNWVSGVASTGTFTRASAMTKLKNGASGIPNGWTVVAV